MVLKYFLMLKLQQGRGLDLTTLVTVLVGTNLVFSNESGTFNDHWVPNHSKRTITKILYYSNIYIFVNIKNYWFRCIIESKMKL